MYLLYEHLTVLITITKAVNARRMRILIVDSFSSRLGSISPSSSLSPRKESIITHQRRSLKKTIEDMARGFT